MLSICCVCGYILDKDKNPTIDRPNEDNKDISHGYCNFHFGLMMKNVDDYRKGIKKNV